MTARVFAGKKKNRHRLSHRTCVEFFGSGYVPFESGFTIPTVVLVSRISARRNVYGIRDILWVEIFQKNPVAPIKIHFKSGMTKTSLESGKI